MAGKSRPVPVMKRAGRRRKVRGKAPKKMGKVVGLAVRVFLAVQYAFSSTTESVACWLDDSKVAKARGLWEAESSTATNKLLKRLQGEERFTSCAVEAASKAKNGAQFWQVASGAWAGLSRSEKPGQQTESDTFRAVDGSCLSTDKVTASFVQKKQAHTRKAAEFVPTDLIVRGVKYLKSPNRLLCVADCPAELRDDKLFKHGNCTPNSITFMLQEALQQGYTALFKELCQNFPTGSSLDHLANCLLRTKGQTCLQTEKAKNAVVLEHKADVHREFEETELSNFRIWCKKFGINTLKAKLAICSICHTKVSVQKGPNLSRDEFEELIGVKEPQVLRLRCTNCTRLTIHSVEYVLSETGFYVDHIYETKESTDVREVLSICPKNVKINNSKFHLICTPTAEFYNSYAHQFLTKEQDDNVMEVNDVNPRVWAELFATPLGTPHPWPMYLTGALYGQDAK